MLKISFWEEEIGEIIAGLDSDLGDEIDWQLIGIAILAVTAGAAVVIFLLSLSIGSLRSALIATAESLQTV